MNTALIFGILVAGFLSVVNAQCESGGNTYQVGESFVTSSDPDANCPRCYCEEWGVGCTGCPQTARYAPPAPLAPTIY